MAERPVYPPEGWSVPAAAAARWGADPASLARVTLGANAIYALDLGGERCFLRITSHLFRSQPQVEGALDFARHLAGAEVPVSAPVESRAGALTETLEDAGALYFAGVVRGVPGEPLGDGLEDRPLHVSTHDPAPFRALGRSMGQLHRAAETYEPRLGLRFHHWEREWHSTGRRLEGDPGPARAAYARLAAWLATLPRGPADLGMTHADYNLGNVLWDGETAWVIDFDEPHPHWFAADLTRALLDFVLRPERERLHGWVLEGYRQARALDARWERELESFVRLADLEEYAWLGEVADHPAVAQLFERYETPPGAQRAARLERLLRPPGWF